MLGQKEKTKEVNHPIKCTLEDLYKGKTTRINVKRDRICADCSGQGVNKSRPLRCGPCQGRGVLEVMDPLRGRPAILPCDSCQGEGKTYPTCEICFGKKTEKKGRILECKIEQGAPHGQRYTFAGEADECAGKITADVNFIVSQQKHESYKRQGADLLRKQTINLMQSMCGVDMVLTHIDGSQFRVQSEPNQVIKPGHILTIEGKGMPFHKNPREFGNLFILFDVQLPNRITQEQSLAVKQCLSSFEGQTQTQLTEEQLENPMILQPQKYDKSQRNNHAQGGNDAYDSDEAQKYDDAGSGLPPQCAQQ